MYISLWENSRGHPDNVSFMQFSTKIDGFEQKDSQGFENSYNSYEQYPLEKFFIFTIYQNYTLALTPEICFYHIFIRLFSRNITPCLSWKYKTWEFNLTTLMLRMVVWTLLWQLYHHVLWCLDLQSTCSNSCSACTLKALVNIVVDRLKNN